MSTFYIGISLAYFSLLILTIYSIVTYRSLIKELKFLVQFVLITTAVQLIAHVLKRFGFSNMIVLHFYVPIGFAFITRFYQKVLKNYFPKEVISIIIFLFFSFSIVNTLLWEAYTTFNSIAITTESVLIVILSLSTYILTLDPSVRMYSYINWINSGFFLYYSSNILFFFYGDYLMSRAFSVKSGQLAWMPHAVFSTIMYSCFLVGLIKSKRQQLVN